MQAETHIPHICSGEVRGSDGSVAWLMKAPDVPTVDLWACDADRRNMARVVLDDAARDALIALLESLRKG